MIPSSICTADRCYFSLLRLTCLVSPDYNVINTFIFSPCLQDLYVYVSQDEVFSDFNNTEALFWFHRDLVYGDWATGENGDGCYEHYKDMEIPEVGMTEDGEEVQLRDMLLEREAGEQGESDVTDGREGAGISFEVDVSEGQERQLGKELDRFVMQMCICLKLLILLPVWCVLAESAAERFPLHARLLH